DIKANILEIGKAVKRSASSNALVQNFERTLAAMEKSNSNTKRHPKLLSYSAGAMPGGKNTLIDDIIKAAGGINLAAKVGINGWSVINTEILMTLEPEYLIVSEG